VGSSVKKSFGLLILALLGQQFLGALTFPVARFGLDIIEPFTFAFYRFVISSVVLLSIVRFTRYEKPIEKKDYLKIVGIGFLIIPFNQLMYLYGQSLTGAGHASLLFATTPIWIFLAALIHLKERLVLRRAVGIVIALTGVIVIMTTGAIKISTEYLWGDLIVLVAVRKYGALRVTAYALASGSALYFPFGLYFASRFDYSATSTAGWLSVLYVALGVSVVAYVLWYWVLKYLEASRIAVYHNLQPIIATFVAWLWLGEQPGLAFIFGGLVVLTGVIVAEV